MLYTGLATFIISLQIDKRSLKWAW